MKKKDERKRFEIVFTKSGVSVSMYADSVEDAINKLRTKGLLPGAGPYDGPIYACRELK